MTDSRPTTPGKPATKFAQLPVVVMLIAFRERLGIKRGEIPIGLSLTILTLTAGAAAQHPLLWAIAWLPLTISLVLLAIGVGLEVDRTKPLHKRVTGFTAIIAGVICLILTAGIGLSMIANQDAWHARNAAKYPPVSPALFALFAASWLLPGGAFYLGLRRVTDWSIRRCLLWGAVVFAVSPVAFLVLYLLLGGAIAGN